LSAGSVGVTVPDVDPKDSYIVVRAYLMLLLSRDSDAYSTALLAVIGDSGNASGKFTISA
jgi:hypothetical protein